MRGSNIALFGNVAGRAGAAAASLELDALDNLYAVHSVKRVLTSYTGNLLRLRRTDATEQDFGYDGTGWVDASAISTFLGGGTGWITTLYDQSGNSRPATQTSDSLQPVINMAGTNPTVDFATNKFLSVPAGLGFARLAGARSLMAVGKFDTTTTATKTFVFVSRGVTNAARMFLGTVTTADHRVGGRRLDADSFDGVTGFTADTLWHAHIGRFDWTNAQLHYRRDSETETDDPFQDAGSTSDTDSLDVRYGLNAAGTQPFDGEMTLAALVSDLLTTQEESDINTELQGLKL